MFDPSNLVQYFKDWLSQMNLVTRDEFDIQAQVLARTRLKVDELTKRLNELEKPKHLDLS